MLSSTDFAASPTSLTLTPRAGERTPIVLSSKTTALVGASPHWFGFRGAQATTHAEMSVALGATPLEVALREGRAALVPLHQALPEKETALAYLGWAASLAGVHSTEPQLLHVAGRFGFAPLARSAIKSLLPRTRRALVAAASYVSGAGLLVLEDPLAGLPVDVADEFALVLWMALSGKTLVWLCSDLARPSALASRVDEAVWFHGTTAFSREKTRDVRPAEHASSLVTFRGVADAFANELTTAQLSHRMLERTPGGGACVVKASERWRIFAAAEASRVVVTELRPTGAFD